MFWSWLGILIHVKTRAVAPVGDTDPSSQNYELQQNELLFRGMSELREDFLFVTLTSPLSTPIIVRMLTGLAEETSTWASLQQGVRGAIFGVSLPAALVASVADQAGLIRKRLSPLTLTHTATSRSIPESVRDAWQWINPLLSTGLIFAIRLLTGYEEVKNDR
jgi:hypothetical protein